MNWYKVFYWLTIADNAKDFFVVGIVITTIVAVIATGMNAVCRMIRSDERTKLTAFGDDEKYKKKVEETQESIEGATLAIKLSARWIRWSYPFCWLFWLLYVLTPSKQDSILIISGGAVGNFLTTDSSSAKIPADLTRYLHLSFQKEIDELDEDQKKELGLDSATLKQKKKLDVTEKLKQMTKEQIIDYLSDSTSQIK